MQRPLIVLFVGVPGSGKTTFAKKLAAELHAVTLASDSIRLAMWGSLEAIAASHTTEEERKQTNLLTFGAMNYAAEQIVAAGHSVVFDCIASRYAERAEKHEIAEKHGTLSIVVRMRVPRELSIKRIQERPASHDARRFDNSEKATEVVDKFQQELEEPEAPERYVEISGEAAFDEQFQVFMAGVDAYLKG